MTSDDLRLAQKEIKSLRKRIKELERRPEFIVDWQAVIESIPDQDGIQARVQVVRADYRAIGDPVGYGEACGETHREALTKARFAAANDLRKKLEEAEEE